MGKRKSRGNGEGTIFKREIRGSVYWVVCYKPENSNKITKYCKTRAEANDKLKEIMIKDATGKIVKKSIITFEQLAQSMIDDELELNKIAEGTYARKISTLNIVKKHYISSIPLQNVQGKDVKDFLKSITNYSDSVIQKLFQLCKKVFKRAIKKEIITYNFFEDEEYEKPKSNKITKKVSAFSVDDERAFLEAIRTHNIRYKTQFYIALFTGMRIGEINALTINDVDLKNRKIIINKTLTRNKDYKTIMGKTTKTYAGTRNIDIFDDLYMILKDYIDNEYKSNPQNLLFLNSKSTYVSAQEINSVFKRFCEKYDIGIGWYVNEHMLRHTFATRCIESGMSASVLAKILGHADIETTLNTYTNVFAEYEKEHSQKAQEYFKRVGIMI